MANCNPCGTEFPVEYLPLLNCKNQLNTRQAGIAQLAFIKCSTNVTSLTSASDWDTIRGTAGALIRTPNGLGSFGKPNTTDAQIGCKERIITEKTLTLTFKTYKYDNATFTDADFMCQLNDSFNAYNLIWLGCDGNLYYSNAYTSGTNPGFEMDLLTSWDDNPENGLMAKNFEITIDMIETCYAIIAPSAALVAAIFEGTANTSGGSGV
jgi:hypothetical protein